MTIKDIARLSGCGVSTVSRVLNKRPDVSEQTRARVLKVVEEYRFQPNSNAKHLKQQASSSIAVLVKGTQNMLFSDMVEKIQNLFYKKGHEVNIHYLDEDADETRYAAQLYRERKPLGFMFLGGNLDYFREGFSSITIPSVLLTNTAAALSYQNLSSFTTDDRAASSYAMDYLISKGHEKIGVIGGNFKVSEISRKRLYGCEDSLRRHGLAFDRQRDAVAARFSMAAAYDATQRLLQKRQDLTAIFAMGDIMAVGAIRALTDAGKEVPRDISVVGYDGVELSRYSIPRLTTIKQNTKQIVEQAVETLLRNILLHAQKPVHKIIDFKLIEGESTRAVNSDK